MSKWFDELQTVLGDWPEVKTWPKNVEDGVFERIYQILEDAQINRNIKEWQSDLKPLLRQILLRETKLTENTSRLRVPSVSGWPDINSWENHGLVGIEAGPSATLLSAQEWFPEWLGSSAKGVFSDAFSDNMVRQRNNCPIDPFIQHATGFENYSCPGQREAVRAAFLIPKGDTLLVNLPTGMGKSLVGQAPTLVHKEDGNLTLFVVPTVALALDQERVMRGLFGKQGSITGDWPLAWYGGLTEEERFEIRKRIRNGTQRILFTSPEALTTSLLGEVLETVHADMLRYLVIDEAHLITQWGDEFRPSFQALAGLRNSMLKIRPDGFRTLLMSATFAEETVEILANLFGPKDRVQMLSAVHLRPEPQYWFYEASSSEEKERRVLEALKYAPRPFILYVTKREEVKHWNSILRSRAGLKRIATFDGKTGASERKRIIDQWSKNHLDGVIATSAFGVGIDKKDVRTVIHATIPETLDRFYQEVGRGGRDGKPSVSLLIYEDSDWKLPKDLASPKIISDELGFKRWKAMCKSRQKTGKEDFWEIDIDAVRQGLPSGSEFNVDWNMRTLILMARAGLIQLELQDNSNHTTLDHAEEASSLLAAMTNVRVRILNGGHLIPEVWEEAVGNSRNSTLNAAKRNLEMMGELLVNCSSDRLRVGREVGEILCELYRIHSTHWPVQVSHVCGGCPIDRINNVEKVQFAQPLTIPVQRITEHSFAEWTTKFPYLNSPFVFIFYDVTKELETIFQVILRFATWLVQSCGVSEVAIDPTSQFAKSEEWKGLYKHTPNKVLFHQSLQEVNLEPASPTARLTVLDVDVSLKSLQEVQLLQRPFHVVLLPNDTTDPTNDLRRLQEVSPNSTNLESLIQEIS